MFSEHATVIVLPVTSTMMDAPLLRITVEPSVPSGLKKPSQIMIDKAMTIKRDKTGLAFEAHRYICNDAGYIVVWRFSWNRKMSRKNKIYPIFSTKHKVSSFGDNNRCLQSISCHQNTKYSQLLATISSRSSL